jgi:hypothetical protein
VADSCLTENTLAAITDKKAGFRSLGEPCADTGRSTGRLMYAVLGSVPDVESDLCGRGRLSKFWRGLYGALGDGWLRLVSLCRQTLIALYSAG